MSGNSDVNSKAMQTRIYAAVLVTVAMRVEGCQVTAKRKVVNHETEL